MQYSDLLGTPFRLWGRGKDGIDCLGVVIEIHRRLGNDIPDPLIELHTAFNETEVLTACKAGPWCEVVGGYEIGDVPIFRDNAGRIHVGVLVTNSHMLHATETHGVIVSPLHSRAQSIQKVYRFDAKADNHT